MYPFPHLPPSLGRAIFSELCRGLPPPHEDTEAARDDRDMFAMAAVHALDARDAAEAMIAIRVVGHEAQARHTLAAAARHDDDPVRADKCRAQAALMGREAQRALRSLQSLQALRPAEAPRPMADIAPGDAASDQHAAVPPKPAPYGVDRPLPAGIRWKGGKLPAPYEALYRKLHRWDDDATPQPASAPAGHPEPGPPQPATARA